MTFLGGLLLLALELAREPVSRSIPQETAFWSYAVAAQDSDSSEGSMAFAVIAELADPKKSAHQNATKVVADNWETSYTPSCLRRIPFTMTRSAAARS